MNSTDTGGIESTEKTAAQAVKQCNYTGESYKPFAVSASVFTSL